MGRAKHCSGEKRELIKKLITEGKTYSQIRNIIGCSNKMIRNAITHQYKAETRGRKTVTPPLMVNRIVRQIKKAPFMSATEIKKELNLPVSTETISRRLRKNNLKSHIPRKVPLLTKKHAAKRLEFAKSHVDWPIEKWRNILWTDESKIVLFGGKGARTYVRRPPNSEFQPQYTSKTVKHGGSRIMIWGCFSYYGVGPIHRIDTIMDAEGYVRILDEVMLPYASEEMPLIWIMQQDNDPKHTSKKAKKKWFNNNGVTVMEWPAQSPDLNPIENLWTDIKKKVYEVKPTNNNDLWITIQEAWYSISSERCRNLVNSMLRRCKAVIKNKGNATKY